jgi:hypothetical protein
LDRFALPPNRIILQIATTGWFRFFFPNLHPKERTYPAITRRNISPGQGGFPAETSRDHLHARRYGSSRPVDVRAGEVEDCLEEESGTWRPVAEVVKDAQSTAVEAKLVEARRHTRGRGGERRHTEVGGQVARLGAAAGVQEEVMDGRSSD